MLLKPRNLLTGLLLCAALATTVLGQQINVQTPLTNVSDSFFSRTGVGFGFSLPGGRGNGSRIVGLNALGQQTPNINFTQNGVGSAIPPFGGFDPNAGARFGFNRLSGNGGGFSLGFDFNQGSNRSITSTAPSVTVQNGFGGSIANGATQPFVTGVIPGVFGAPRRFDSPSTFVPQPRVNAVTQAIQSGQLNLGGPVPERKSEYKGPINYSSENSTAQQSDISVAAIKAQRNFAANTRAEEIDEHLRQSDAHAAAGDYRLARVSLRAAIKLTEQESYKAELKNKLEGLKEK